ncbi:MAG: 16S rRNA (cytosine(1402)-N(4))-methyltransferase RsmH [Deltaproteobacteria bacterium]|nr:16S rRNA (cytosine(1402)-N(4))-methyltransferase RsmH [Deltaproteobacteria bacterium]
MRDEPLFQTKHQPVLCEEVVSYLRVSGGQGGSPKIYVDGTVGEGGHAARILEASFPSGILIGLDRDEEAIRRVRERLNDLDKERSRQRIILMAESYSSLPLLLEKIGFTSVDGVVLDLGLSSRQLGEANRGFSFQKEGPLDMRFDNKTRLTAEQIINRWPENKIAECLNEFGEESWSKKIASVICQRRKKQKIQTTTELASLVRSAIPRQFRSRRIDPATKTFQALRITVNQELNELKLFLNSLETVLNDEGRAAVISYHSLEDRLVKNAFRAGAQRGLFSLITKKPVLPSEQERNSNPRARSAKLRVVEKRESLK